MIDGLENPYAKSWYKGQEAIVLAIFRQPGSNVVQVTDTIKKVLPQFQANLPPSVKLDVVFDRSQIIRASIDDVQTTLLIAGALVVGVIFVFLRRVSATIIPSLALPIAVIGTFAGMSAFGFNLDNLSLMALTLSVGFVVDDAIVMLENIVRHIEMGEKPYDAAMKGSGEIGFTILSMTISLAAVFIPIVFMGGIVGRLLHEFAVTIIMAILFSGVISITLTPMLCARILKDEHGQKHNWFYRLERKHLQRGAGLSMTAPCAGASHHGRDHPGRLLRQPGRSAWPVDGDAAGLPAQRRYRAPAGQHPGRQRHLLSPDGRLYAAGRARSSAQDPDVEGVLAQMEGANGSAGTNQAR